MGRIRLPRRPFARARMKVKRDHKSWERGRFPMGVASLAVRRKGEDTLATVSRPSGDLGPLNGRFDGVSSRCTISMEPRRPCWRSSRAEDNGLDLEWKAPGEDVKKHKAIRATAQR